MSVPAYEIVNPDAAGTVASLASFGYSVEAAVADLVDNSIAAAARRVGVYFTWAGKDSWVAVVDDGEGMTASQLVTAMTVAAGAFRSDRTRTDLGRFGMGLKSASFSQSHQLTVTSTVANGEWSTRTWDLATVTGAGEWRLVIGSDEATEEILAKLRAQYGSGTVVLWRQLRRYCSAPATDETQKQLYAEQDRVRIHLGMVFARFLQRRVRLTVADDPVRPWDPFLLDHPSVTRLAPERLPIGDHVIKIDPFVLPHPKRLSPAQSETAPGPGGWLDQQGFYIYRRDRLIVSGDWLGLRGLRRDERFNLARIAIDVPAELDADWHVDVRKSSVVPPVAIRRQLRRIANASRGSASKMLHHRGLIARRQHGAEFAFAWRVDRQDGQITCRVNRQHPLVQHLLRSDSADSGDVRALLRLLEETVPIAALRTLHRPGTADDAEPFADAASDELAEIAERIYQADLRGGRTHEDALHRIRHMQPFDKLGGFWNAS